MSDPQTLLRSFQELYHTTPRLFSAPGRINLIGEHTDYNEGFVLPMAAQRRTYVAAASRADRQVRVCSFDLQDEAIFDLDRPPDSSEKRWVNYIHGVAQALADTGFKLNGAELAISSEVPIGAGLSSSAALEISTGYALLKIADAPIDLMQLAITAQQAEHRYVGTQSGLMDQLTAVFGERRHALFIDCRSLDRRLIPLNISEMIIVVCDTKVKHNLATSAYNQRRQECERAVEMLRKKKPGIRALRDVSVADLEQLGYLLPQLIRRRCRHVVTENERTLQAAEALRNSDTCRLGKLMNLSHQSLRDDFEVSCRELDIMVELAQRQKGVAGARMMGGGFGGSTVNLVRRSAIKTFVEQVSEGYKQATGISPTIIVSGADDGVRELRPFEEQLW